MSDTRFILIGAALILAGLGIMGAWGHDYQASTIESDEFGTCYDYDEDPPLEVNCSQKISNQFTFFGLVLGLVIAGIVSLIKGAKGDWDSKVRPEDMAGPGNNGSK